MDVAPGADNPVGPDVGGIEAGHERGDAAAVESKQCAGGLVDLGHARGTAVDRHRRRFVRLGAEEVAGGVDAVDADVVQGSATELFVRCGYFPHAPSAKTTS